IGAVRRLYRRPQGSAGLPWSQTPFEELLLLAIGEQIALKQAGRFHLLGAYPGGLVEDDVGVGPNNGAVLRINDNEGFRQEGVVLHVELDDILLVRHYGIEVGGPL